MHDLYLSNINGPTSPSSSKQDESDSSRLNTPQFFGISPTLTAQFYSGNNADMPSTAEIIQKCLSVNPFDMKFREANMQINGQTPEQRTEQRVGAQPGLPIPPAGIMLKLPSSMSQSPNIFSNMLSAAEIEGEIRKSLDFTRKVQQLRDASLVKQEGNRSPCTADVLNAVLDMNMNQTINIPSTSALVAGLTAAAATTNNSNSTSTTSTAGASTASSSSTVAPTTISTTGLLASRSSEQPELGRSFAFAVPSITDAISNPISQANLAATTAAAALLQQQTTIANMISSQQSSLRTNFNASTNQNMPNLHTGFQSSPNNSVSASNALAAPRASPALNNHSPRPTSHLIELHKNNATDMHRAASVDPWDGNTEVKPLINKTLQPYSMYDSTHGRLELKTEPFSSALNGAASSANSSSSGSQPNSHLEASESTKTHRKYARYQNPSNDDQFTSGRSVRGRRSITSEMPPDERRMTILERNKAAAVRYRKRKKEEHDEMIGRVHGLEQDKVFLQTQNSVYKREIDRLNELIKARDSRCICRAHEGLQIFTSNADNNDLPGASDTDKLSQNGSLKHGNSLLLPKNS